MKKLTTHSKSPETEGKKMNVSILKNNWVPVLFIGLLVVLFMFLRLTNMSGPSMADMKNKIIPEAVKKVVNNPSTKIEVTSAKETNGLVEFELVVNNQKYTSYISRDGKILFTSGVKMEDVEKAQGAASSASTKALTCNDVNKSDKPNLTAFIVADCPFGVQMQRVFKKSLAELPELSSYLKVRYIGSIEDGKITSMHDQAPGGKEAMENLRQICIREEQSNLYWPYVSCYMQEGKTESCLDTVGADKTNLTSCMTDPARGNAYAQKDFDLANKYKVTGSPTLLANEKQIVSEFDFGGRVPNAIKQLLCCASSDKPGFCETEISKSDVAVSFSLTDEAAAGTNTNSAAGCQ